MANSTIQPDAAAQAYIAGLLQALGTQAPLEVLRHTPSRLRDAVQGLSEDQLHRREAPDRWSVAHGLQHLADSEIASGWRIRQILAHDRPTLTGYDQDLWAERLRYDQADPNLALEQFGVLRRPNLRLLVRASPDELKRVGVHVERGEESLEHLCRLYAGHDLLHLRQIERVRRVLSHSG